MSGVPIKTQKVDKRNRKLKRSTIETGNRKLVYRNPGVGSEPDPGVGGVLALLEQLLFEVRVDELHISSSSLVHLSSLPPLLSSQLSVILPPTLVQHPLLSLLLLLHQDLLMYPKG